jgi:hypothetical protein
MAMLPTAVAPAPLEDLYRSSSGGLSNSVPLIFRRLHRFQQMACGLITIRPASDTTCAMFQDFELAAWQLTYLCLAPKRVYVDLYYPFSEPWTDPNQDTGMCIFTNVSIYRYFNAISLTGGIETKNTWARDDPAILILLSACLCSE